MALSSLVQINTDVYHATSSEWMTRDYVFDPDDPFDEIQVDLLDYLREEMKDRYDLYKTTPQTMVVMSYDATSIIKKMIQCRQIRSKIGKREIRNVIITVEYVYPDIQMYVRWS